jgi:integrase
LATIYWRKDRAYLNWRENGTQFRISLGKIEAREAERIRSAKEAELTHGVTILSKTQTVTKYLEWYLEWYAGEHPTTVAKCKSEFKKFMGKFGHRPIDSIRPTEVEDFKRERLRTDGAAPETVGKELRRLKAAFRRGVEWKELDSHPLEFVRAPRGVRSVAVKFYATPDMKKLYKANAKRASLWAFMAHTGIRRGEMCKMVKSDVIDGVLRIESEPDADGDGRTKSGHWREVPLNRQAKAALKKLGDRPVRVHPDTLSDWFSVDAKAAKIGGTLHRLRHTFCAHLAMAGVPLRRIQILAGHSDYKITEKYAHLAPGGADGAVAKLKF